MVFRSAHFWWDQFNLSVQITRYFVICKFRIAIVNIFVSLTFRLEFKIICKAERTIKLPNKNVTYVGDGWGFRKIFLWATERRLKSILEAVAERIGCFEAHRSSQPNGNL